MTGSRAAAIFGAALLVAVWLAMPAREPVGGPTPPAEATSGRSRLDPALRALQSGADRMRERLHSAPAPASTSRNPFQFAPRPRPATPRPAPTSEALPPGPPPTPPRPLLTLVGIGEDRTPAGPVRTAVLSGRDQVFLVKEGAEVAGRFKVIAIDQRAVELLDLQDQTRVRLVLR
jgi:hypothetical protein